MGRPITATAFAIDEIRRLIVGGDLRPGEELDQSSLAKRLDISRLPVRQALTHLASQKFVNLRDHRSAVVTPVSKRDMNDLYALRHRLENWGFCQSFSNFTGDIAQKLETQIAKTQAIVDLNDHDAFMAANREFHFFLFSVIDNGYVVDSLRDLFDLSERYQWMCTRAPGVMSASLAEHREIVDRIQAGDLEGFLSLSQQHNQKTIDWVIRHKKIGEVGQ